LDATKASFDVFSQSRCSIRDFDPQSLINLDEIIAAIDIARKAPSACNRQSAFAHIYEGAKAHELFDFQGGANGFGHDMQYAILITADMRRYFINERHQMFVDGGLFAMDLLFALHYKGLATIPLTTAYKTNQTRKLKKTFGIPSNEVPVMIIGVGAYKETYKVAVSHRKPLEAYYQVHR
jgi:nitroreductase